MPPDLSVLFPSEDPSPPAARPGQTKAPAPADPAAMLFADENSEKPADKGSGMFPTEARPDPSSAVGSTLGPWADSLKVEGRADAAQAMRETADALASDFAQNGLSAEDTQEVMSLAREALGDTTMPGVSVDGERLAQMRVQGEAFVAENGISHEDLGLARCLISDLDKKTSGRVSQYLNDTGMGNRPETIAKAVELARRRYNGR